MADTDSIASRMQKLAKLKRRKTGQTDAPVPEADTDNEAVFAMPGPTTAANADTPASADLDTRDDEPSFAPELGGVDDAGDESVAESDPVVEDPAPADQPAAKVEDRDDESLSSYFAALGIAPENAEENPAAFDEPDAPATEPASAIETDDDNLDELLEAIGEDTGDATPETPDFSAAEVDPETIAREFEHEQPAPEPARPRAAATADDDGRITVTFDESRTTLLNHVSRQMNCSVDDVVVTALDWYLDALFGEDEAKAG